MEQWSQSSGSNVIPRRARPGLAGLRPHMGLGFSFYGLRARRRHLVVLGIVVEQEGLPTDSSTQQCLNSTTRRRKWDSPRGVVGCRSRSCFSHLVVLGIVVEQERLSLVVPPSQHLRANTGEKTGLLIRKHEHFTPSRKMRRDVRAVTARNHPEGRFYPMERLGL